MSKNKVCICVLNFQSKSHTVELLNSLNSLIGNFEVCLLENGSTHTAFEKSDIPSGLKYKFFYYSSQENLGFAGGNNYLINKAFGKFDYYWLLNNDTLVNPNSLQEMQKVFETNSNVGIVGSLLLYPDNKTIWWCGSKLKLNVGSVQKLFYGQNKNVVGEDTIATDEVTGTSMLISQDAIKKVGLMDESFFHTWEDTDYSIRAINCGFKLYVSSKSVVIHKVGKSSGSEYSTLHMYYVERGRVLIMKKYGYLKVTSLVLLIPLWVKRILAPLIKVGSIKSSIYTFAGIIDGIHGTTGKKVF